MALRFEKEMRAEESGDGVQGSVPASDAGAGAEDVQEPVEAGRLMQHVDEKAHEASRMFQEMTAGKRDQYGDLPPHIRCEAEEVVRATLIEFPPENQPTPDDPLATTPPR